MNQNEIARKWWLIVIQGLLGVVFGLLSILLPDKSLTLVTWLIGAYLLLEGIVAILFGLIHLRFGWSFVIAILSVIVGLIFISNPSQTLDLMFFILALWLVVTGVIRIFISFFAKDGFAGGWLILGSGILSVVFGILLFTQPTASIALAGILFGTAILMIGILYTALGFQLRELSSSN